jgi:hypothetical protein
VPSIASPPSCLLFFPSTLPLLPVAVPLQPAPSPPPTLSPRRANLIAECSSLLHQISRASSGMQLLLFRTRTPPPSPYPLFNCSVYESVITSTLPLLLAVRYIDAQKPHACSQSLRKQTTNHSCSCGGIAACSFIVDSAAHLHVRWTIHASAVGGDTDDGADDYDNDMT